MVNVWAQSPGTTKFSPHDQRLGAGSPGSATFGRRVNGVVRSRRRGVPASDPCSGLRGVPATAPPFVHPAADRSTAWSTFGRTVQASAKFHPMINLRAHSPGVRQVPPHDQPSGAQGTDTTGTMAQRPAPLAPPWTACGPPVDHPCTTPQRSRLRISEARGLPVAQRAQQTQRAQRTQRAQLSGSGRPVTVSKGRDLGLAFAHDRSAPHRLLAQAP